jgi:UDP-glucose 4-epimerase
MDTIFIIGGSGFVGRHLVRDLAARGHRVIATIRPGSQPPAGPGVEWIPTDLAASDISTWPARYDAVVSLVQSSRRREWPGGADDMLRVNVDAMHRAAEHARTAGAKRFINMSTGTIYAQTGKPSLETESIYVDSARSFYAATKVAAELLLTPYSQFFGVIQFRLFMPYGPGQDERMLFPLVAKKVREGVPVDLHGQNGLISNPTAIADVAEAVHRCLFLDGSHLLNLGGPEVLSLRHVADAIGAVIGRAPRFNVMAEPPPAFIGDTSRLQAVLGWQPMTRFADGVRAWLS